MKYLWKYAFYYNTMLIFAGKKSVGGEGKPPPLPGSDAYDMMHVAVKYETRSAFS